MTFKYVELEVRKNCILLSAGRSFADSTVKVRSHRHTGTAVTTRHSH